MCATVLIVEDEAIVAMDIQAALEELGHAVCGIAKDGYGAVEIASRTRPDVALMDIVLPGDVDGIDTALELDNQFGIPSLFLTGFSERDYVRRAAAVMPTTYMMKPFNPRELGANIELAMARRSRESDQTPPAILDILPIAYQSLDKDGRFRSVNREWLSTFGYQRQDVWGRSFTDFIRPEDLPVFKDRFKRFKEVGHHLSEDVEIRHKEGHYIAAFFFGRTETNPHTGSTVTHCILQDSRARREYEGALRAARLAAEEASREKSRFIAAMSHEIRTPLTSILGFSEVLSTEALGPMHNPRYKEYAQDINESGVHLLELINDILDLSRIESGRMELFVEKVNIAELVRHVLRIFGALGDEADLSIETMLDPALPNLSVDRRALRQMILNLLSNAVKFTPEGGRIVVHGEHAPSGEVHLSVTDTGIGISPSEMARVFEPFGRGSSEQVRNKPGAGLGLALVKSLMQSHGGDLTLASRPGKGTTATLVFPPERAIVGDDLQRH